MKDIESILNSPVRIVHRYTRVARTRRFRPEELEALGDMAEFGAWLAEVDRWRVELEFRLDPEKRMAILDEPLYVKVNWMMQSMGGNYHYDFRRQENVIQMSAYLYEVEARPIFAHEFCHAVVASSLKRQADSHGSHFRDILAQLGFPNDVEVPVVLDRRWNQFRDKLYQLKKKTLSTQP